MKQRGLTLLELLIVLAMTAIILVGLTGSYEVALRYQREMPAREAARQSELNFVRQLRQALEGAYLSSDEADFTSFFIASSSGGVEGDPDTLTFTSTAFAPAGDYVQSADDFETLHTDYGPQGGLTEVALSISPVGDAPNEAQTGLYLRKQRPSDGDPTQGGTEELLNADIETIGFEFWDGVDWITAWDTTAGTRRLPAAVRMFYQVGDEQEERVIVIRLLQSDVTLDNPVLENGGTGAAGAAAAPAATQRGRR